MTPAPHRLDRAAPAGFAELVGGGGAVVDLGCGPGRVTAHLAALGLSVFGLDLSESMLATARRENPGLRFEQVRRRSWTLPTGRSRAWSRGTRPSIRLWMNSPRCSRSSTGCLGRAATCSSASRSATSHGTTTALGATRCHSTSAQAAGRHRRAAGRHRIPPPFENGPCTGHGTRGAGPAGVPDRRGSRPKRNAVKLRDRASAGIDRTRTPHMRPGFTSRMVILRSTGPGFPGECAAVPVFGGTSPQLNGCSRLNMNCLPESTSSSAC